MSILIADSGSTKTDWTLLADGKVIKQIKTIGFNPYFQSRDEVSLEILNKLKPLLQNELANITEVNFYGAGCSTPENNQLIYDAISITLDLPGISVNHDLLAAARALCMHEWGIAGILGTGSNSCLYNGVDIIENVPSTGYLWSDYGGGSQIGKYFVRDYFEGRLPKELCDEFAAAGYNREVILQNVYKQSVPSRYLASISNFVFAHMEHPSISKILEECFDSFFDQQVRKYTNSHKYKVHTVGSIGFFYKDFIATVAKKHGYQMGNVIRSPIEGLIQYHSKF